MRSWKVAPLVQIGASERTERETRTTARAFPRCGRRMPWWRTTCTWQSSLCH